MGIYSVIRRFIMRSAYPNFECENCIGMMELGCKCSYDGAIAPNVPPTRFHIAMRWIFWKGFHGPRPE